MLSREQIRDLALEAKDRKGLTWPEIGKAMDRSPIYAAMLVYGYGQATAADLETTHRQCAGASSQDRCGSGGGSTVGVGGKRPHREDAA